MRAPFPTPTPEPKARSLEGDPADATRSAQAAEAKRAPRGRDASAAERTARDASGPHRRAAARPNPWATQWGNPWATSWGGDDAAAEAAVRAAPASTIGVDAVRLARFRRMLRLMIWTCIVAHGLFLVVFAALGVDMLALLNIGSLLAYGVALTLLRRGRTGVAFGIGVVEIVTHGILATVTLGWSAGFHYYLPVLAVMMFLYPRASMRTTATAAGALGAIYAALALYANAAVAPVHLSTSVLHAMNVTNGFYFTVVLAILSYVSTSVARNAEDGLRDAVAALDEIARKDNLTGLMNRRSMEQELRREAARHNRNGSPFAIAIADLDGFKGINDRFGHHAGDRVLAASATRMRDALRLHDQVARWGGEEFLVLLPDTEAGEAEAVAERLRCALGDLPVQVDGKFVEVTVTIGVAVFRGGDWSGTLRDADRALYQGKATGRNRVVVAPQA